MIRRIARLALDALIVEAKLWLSPEPAPTSVTPAAPSTPVKPEYTYTSCIACCADLGGTFGPRESLCAPCVAYRKPRVKRVRKTVPQSSEGEE